MHMKEKKAGLPKSEDRSHEEYQQILSRRDFVSAAAKLATIGALLNFHLGAAWAGNERQVRAFFDKAISIGDMRTALDRYANEFDLTKEQVRALSQFDNNELKVLRSLDKLGFSDPDRTQLADAARSSSNTKDLMKRASKMKFSREQLAGLDRWSSGELDAFNNIVSKLTRSDSLLIGGITDW
jgi:hypothetical protein